MMKREWVPLVLPRPTEAEVNVLDQLIEGYSNEQIGKRLYLATNTVKTHIRHAARDVGARNRVHLAMIYARWKLGKLDNWPKWDGRRREHSGYCDIFHKEDGTCDCTQQKR